MPMYDMPREIGLGLRGKIFAFGNKPYRSLDCIQPTFYGANCFEEITN